MFTLPDLPYEYGALEPYIDEETMKIHHGKHHAAYVNNLNEILKDQPKFLETDVYDLMRRVNEAPENIRKKVINNGGGHANHSFFWKTMSPPKGLKPRGELLAAINASFGDFAGFQESFAKTALNRFGSGWAWLVYHQGDLMITDSANQDNPWMAGQLPILTLDVWEHAYYLKYQNRRADYVKAWWNVVDWEKAARRFTESSE